MKKILLLAFGMLLFACSDSEEKNSLTHDMQIMLDARKGFSKDTVIYLADSVKFVDKLTQIAYFEQDDNTGLSYTAKAMSSAIDIRLYVYPDYSGGSISVYCHPNQDESIKFNEPVFPAKSKGYTLKFKDSLKVGKSMYYDIVEFKTPVDSGNACSISAFYYGIHDGLVQVISKNGIKLNRVSKKVYEDAEERRAKERAQIDSIAQAVADSIIKANTVAVDTSKKDSSTKNSTSKEIIDMAESVADCIKNAYSSGSLSALKDCKI